MLKTSVSAFEVKDEDITNIERKIPSTIISVRDTMKIHQVL
jgi:hypothetical protein